MRPLIQRFEQKCIANANEYETQGHWVQAVAELEHGLASVAKSKALERAMDRLQDRRQDYLEDLERQMKLLEGKMLPTQTELLEKRSEVEPLNLAYRWELYQQTIVLVGLHCNSSHALYQML